jgi:hypothetical protein
VQIITIAQVQIQVVLSVMYLVASVMVQLLFVLSVQLIMNLLELDQLV